MEKFILNTVAILLLVLMLIAEINFVFFAEDKEDMLWSIAAMFACMISIVPIINAIKKL